MPPITPPTSGQVASPAPLPRSPTADMAWARLVPAALQLRQRIDQILIARREPRDPDLGEQAIAAEDEETSDGILAALRSKLADAEAALARVADGSYGLCIACGAPIAEARLRALPTASRCIDCEAAG